MELTELAGVLRDLQSDDTGKGSRTEARRREAHAESQIAESLEMVRTHLGADRVVESLTREEFYELAKAQPTLLTPATVLQKTLREKVVGLKFWRDCTAWRNKHDDGSKLAKVRGMIEKISEKERREAAAKEDYIKKGASSKMYKEATGQKKKKKKTAPIG